MLSTCSRISDTDHVHVIAHDASPLPLACGDENIGNCAGLIRKLVGIAVEEALWTETLDLELAAEIAAPENPAVHRPLATRYTPRCFRFLSTFPGERAAFIKVMQPGCERRVVAYAAAARVEFGLVPLEQDAGSPDRPAKVLAYCHFRTVEANPTLLHKLLHLAAGSMLGDDQSRSFMRVAAHA